MKKTILGLLLLLSVSLTGCAKAAPIPTEQDQLEVLAEQFRRLDNEIHWLDESGVQYAITDLNGNGYLELVVSSIQGSGLFTHSYYYEVNESCDGTTYWISTMGEDASEPDIGVYDVTVYVDTDGVRHYLFDDYIRNGYTENWLGKYDVTYENGQVYATLLASCTNIYQQETEEFDFTCTDADGNPISSETFDAIAGTVFAGMEQLTVHIGWASYSEWTSEPSIETLAQSYALFSIE